MIVPCHLGCGLGMLPAAAGAACRVLRICAAHEAVLYSLPGSARPGLRGMFLPRGVVQVADQVWAFDGVWIHGDHDTTLCNLHRGLLQQPPPV